VATASDDQTVRLWESRTGLPLMALHPGVGAALAVAFSPDGRLLAAGGSGPTNADCQVCVYRLTSRQEQRRLAGHNYMVYGLSFHPVKPVLASGGSDRTVILWDLATGLPRHRWTAASNNPIRFAAYAPGGGLLAVGLGSFNTSSGRDFTVELRDPETGAVRRRLEGPRGNIDALAFDPSGDRLAAGSADGTTHVWDARTGAVVWRWDDPAPAAGVAFLGGGRVVTADAAGHVAVRDPAGGETVRRTTVPGRVSRAAVAPGDDRLAVGGGDGGLLLLSLPDLGPTAVAEKAHAGPVTAVAFSPDGRLLATGGGDRQVVLWDGRTCRRLCSLPQKTDVHDLAFDPDGLRLAVSTSEELITLWNLALVRPELAAVGLDWGGPSPAAAPHPAALAATQPPPDVRLVRAPLRPVSRPATSEAADVLARLGVLYRQGRYQDMVDAGEAAIKATPDAKTVYLALADANYRLGRYDKAADAARRHLDLCPNCAQALSRLANYREAAGATEEAIQLLDRALQVNPNQPLLANNLAWFYVTGPERVRDADKALPLAQRAVALAPNQSTFQHTLGVVYYRLGKYEKAVETLRAVSGPDAPKEAEAFTQLFLAMCYHRLGDAAKAKECFERAPRPGPADRLLPGEANELEAARAEAAALLGVK
jgi:WD40 repeat protein/tetratricopeptide (TPR) repeat protein